MVLGINQTSKGKNLPGLSATTVIFESREISQKGNGNDGSPAYDRRG